MYDAVILLFRIPLTLGGPWAYDFPSDTSVLGMVKAEPTHVPDDWDSDDEEKETDSQKIWETAYAIPFQFPPLSGGESPKLIEIWT